MPRSFPSPGENTTSSRPPTNPPPRVRVRGTAHRRLPHPIPSRTRPRSSTGPSPPSPRSRLHTWTDPSLPRVPVSRKRRLQFRRRSLRPLPCRTSSRSRHPRCRSTSPKLCRKPRLSCTVSPLPKLPSPTFKLPSPTVTTLSPAVSQRKSAVVVEVSAPAPSTTRWARSRCTGNHTSSRVGRVASRIEVNVRLPDVNPAVPEGTEKLVKAQVFCF